MPGTWSVSNAISAINQVANATPDIPNEEKALRNFLSLYNVTMSDGNAANHNGSWEEIAIASGTTNQKQMIREALFGNGTQKNPLIQHLWLGDPAFNNWQRSREALTALGVPNDLTPPHWHHYHIDFNEPKRQPIVSSQNLKVDDAGVDGTADTQNSNPLDSTDLHHLVLELAGEWGLSENDMDMYFPPEQTSTRPPMLIVAAANPSKERVVGACLPVKGGELAEGVLFAFGGAAQDYLIRYEHKDPMDVDISRVQIKLLAVTRQPEHGSLTKIKNDPYQAILYRPDAGYYGKDRVEATVAVGNDIVRVVYNFVVQRKDIERLQPAEDRKLCPKGLFWKISGSSEVGSTVAGGRIEGMNALLSAASQNLTFADLNDSELGQTTGTGPSAQITLDTDAAGHGWYVDYTPYLNDEYLPTSNPLEWIAKPGSEAEGKMDLLTVLLHEYGHALGLDCVFRGIVTV